MFQETYDLKFGGYFMWIHNSYLSWTQSRILYIEYASGNLYNYIIMSKSEYLKFDFRNTLIKNGIKFRILLDKINSKKYKMTFEKQI